MDKKGIAQVLEQIGSLLELKGENPFRVRAYHTAARAIAAFPGHLEQGLASGELAAVKGIGPATLELMDEVRASGRSRLLDTLKDEVPPGLADMMKISGLGVTKIRQLWQSLQIESLAELEEAAKDGRLAGLPRFGKKTAENILKGIAFLRQVSEFRFFHNAREEATALVQVLTSLPEVARAEIVGSVRRRREVIRDLDFLVLLKGPAGALFDRLGRAPGVSEFVHQTDASATLRFASGAVADVFTSTAGQFGFHYARSTGSRSHVEALAARAAAQGFEWTDTGLRKNGAAVPMPAEEDVYKALGLQFVPPELREGRGEVEAAAAGKIPTLVEERDMQGFLHCHTEYSDGTAKVREWAVAGREKGYKYVGITDHSQAAAYAGGLAAADVSRQHAEIDAANKEFPDCRLLKGVEVDILADGSLDYTPEVRATFDFIIASVHARLGQDGKEMTDRVLKAIDNPDTAILGHPTGRLLLSRDPYPLDLDRIFERAAKKGVAIEINADPQRLDLDWTRVREAAEAGVTISIGADAHNTAGMKNVELGIGIARKGCLTKDQVLNARPLEGFLEHVAQRRAKK
ncbi:MAG: DNA polymerase/3'-5' exonuclease PolX [Gemmatimonadetes bacterium]|nr:DNA polymerase/3'-5' exonuclease PolX [Gemmatimonadota bacterium]